MNKRKFFVFSMLSLILLAACGQSVGAGMETRISRDISTHTEGSGLSRCTYIATPKGEPDFTNYCSLVNWQTYFMSSGDLDVFFKTFGPENSGMAKELKDAFTNLMEGDEEKLWDMPWQAQARNIMRDNQGFICDGIVYSEYEGDKQLLFIFKFLLPNKRIGSIGVYYYWWDNDEINNYFWTETNFFPASSDGTWDSEEEYETKVWTDRIKSADGWVRPCFE